MRRERLYGLRDARERASLSQVELAEFVSLSAGTICRLERGQQFARPGTVRRLADALNVAVDALYDGEQVGRDAA